mgnify:CR=1 FL=1
MVEHQIESAEKEKIDMEEVIEAIRANKKIGVIVHNRYTKRGQQQMRKL